MVTWCTNRNFQSGGLIIWERRSTDNRWRVRFALSSASRRSSLRSLWLQRWLDAMRLARVRTNSAPQCAVPMHVSRCSGLGHQPIVFRPELALAGAKAHVDLCRCRCHHEAVLTVNRGPDACRWPGLDARWPTGHPFAWHPARSTRPPAGAPPSARRVK
jgi:hypothetical protein